MDGYTLSGTKCVIRTGEGGEPVQVDYRVASPTSKTCQPNSAKIYLMATQHFPSCAGTASPKKGISGLSVTFLAKRYEYWPISKMEHCKKHTARILTWIRMNWYVRSLIE